MKEGKILVADDNKPILNALQILLQQLFVHVGIISTTTTLMAELKRTDYDLLLLDMNFKAGINTGNEGIYWLREVKKHYPQIEVVMITAYGDVELAVRALKEGAADFGHQQHHPKNNLQRAHFRAHHPGADAGHQGVARRKIHAHAGPTGWFPPGGKCAAHSHAPGAVPSIPGFHRARRENAGNGAPDAARTRGY